MEATVAERRQIALPEAVRDALGLTQGTRLAVERDGGRIDLPKEVDDAIARRRGRFKLDGFALLAEAVRGRAAGGTVDLRHRPLITRDAGFFRDDFEGLNVIEPKAA